MIWPAKRSRGIAFSRKVASSSFGALPERPRAYGVSALQGGFTLWNRQFDPEAVLTARLESVAAGRPSHPANAAEAYAQQVSEAVASDEETSAYVQDLERRVDELADEDDIPSGDAIAAELTRYLRERDNDQGDDDVARER